MNRPIKFRICYTAQNGQKSLIYSDDKRYLITLDGKVLENYGKDWKNPFWEEVFDADEQPIIQQYTGLTDKNNIEVYDGDIVKINRCYTRPFVNEKHQIDYKFIEGEVEIGQVFWGWNTQKYLVSYEHIRYDDIEDFDKPSHRVEVIGNIFEHKHLLLK
jgi:uncharacterized phage protein (TIGR01671 family)